MYQNPQWEDSLLFKGILETCQPALNSLFNLGLSEFNLIPEFFLGVTAVTIVTHCSLITYRNRYGRNVLAQYSVTSLSGLVLLLTLGLYLHEGPIAVKHLSLEFSFLVDSLGFFSRIVTILTSLICVYLFQDYIVEYKINSTEYELLMLYAVLGLTMLIVANDFGTIFLALELQSLSLYVLSGFKKNSIYSVESGLKYFLLGALSTAYFLLGWSLLFGISGLFILLNFYLFYFGIRTTPNTYEAVAMSKEAPGLYSPDDVGVNAFGLSDSPDDVSDLTSESFCCILLPSYLLENGLLGENATADAFTDVQRLVEDRRHVLCCYCESRDKKPSNAPLRGEEFRARLQAAARNLLLTLIWEEEAARERGDTLYADELLWVILSLMNIFRAEGVVLPKGTPWDPFELLKFVLPQATRTQRMEKLAWAIDICYRRCSEIDAVVGVEVDEERLNLFYSCVVILRTLGVEKLYSDDPWLKARKFNTLPLEPGLEFCLEYLAGELPLVSKAYSF